MSSFMARMKTEEKSKNASVKTEVSKSEPVISKNGQNFITAKKTSALAQIASYYSSDEDEKKPEIKTTKVQEDDLLKLHRERKERQMENRKRKFNITGNYFGMGKVT